MRESAGFTGASIGSTGTFGAQQHLRQVYAYLNMLVMGQPELYFNAGHSFGAEGQLTDEKTKKYVKSYWKSLRRLG